MGVILSGLFGLFDPPHQFSGTASSETWLVTFVTEVSLRLAGPQIWRSAIRLISSRSVRRSQTFSALLPPAHPPAYRWWASAAHRHLSLSLSPRHFSALPGAGFFVVQRADETSSLGIGTKPTFLRIFATVTNKSLSRHCEFRDTPRIFLFYMTTRLKPNLTVVSFLLYSNRGVIR